MSNLEKQLIDNKLMQTYEQIDLYEEAVKGLFDKNNPNCINSLIKGFHDETEDYEVMYSNVHSIEYFSKVLGLEKYIMILIPLLKGIEDVAYEWSETFFLRLMNDASGFEHLLFYLESEAKEEDKSFIRKIVNNLISRNPNRFEAKGNEILDILG